VGNIQILGIMDLHQLVLLLVTQETVILILLPPG